MLHPEVAPASRWRHHGFLIVSMHSCTVWAASALSGPQVHWAASATINAADSAASNNIMTHSLVHMCF
jgi:hypothetical protein